MKFIWLEISLYMDPAAQGIKVDSYYDLLCRR